MMSKTPLADKIHNFLIVLEKLTLDKTLDTGFNTSKTTHNWTQAGQDFDKLFGLDDFNKKYGGKANEIDAVNYNSAEAKNLSSKLGTLLFGDELRKHNLNMLWVKQCSNIPENLNPYIWRTKEEYTLLTEANTPVQLSLHNKDFYRLDKTSGIVFTRNPKFIKETGYPGFYFTPTNPLKLGSLLYNKPGQPPHPGIGAAAAIQHYLSDNYKPCVLEAVDHVKSFIQGEENNALVDYIKTFDLNNLPIIIYNALVLGITDAANLNIYKNNENVAQSFTRLGVGSLTPTESILMSLSSLMRATSGAVLGEDVLLPDQLRTAILQILNQVGSAPSTYDVEFIKALKEALEHKKHNMSKYLSSTATVIYFMTSQIVNQIIKIFASAAPRQEEAELYFGHLGYGPVGFRSKQLGEKLALSSAANDLVIGLIRAQVNPANTPGEENVFSVEPCIMTVKKDGKRELASLKPIGIPSLVHSYIINEVEKAGEVKSEDYINYFKQINYSSAIQGAIHGKEYWDAILKTCLKDFKVAENAGGEIAFNEGVLFVLLPRLLFDKAYGGNEIYVPTIKLSGIVKVSFVDNNNVDTGEEDPEAIQSAVEIYIGKVKDPTGNSADKGMAIDEEKVKARDKKIIDTYPLVPLSSIREKLLKYFYTLNTSYQANIDHVLDNDIEDLLSNISHGFWSMDKGKTFTHFNPWAKDVSIYRITPNNTSPGDQNQYIRDEIKKLTTKFTKP